MLMDWLSIAAICVGAEWVGSFGGTYGVGPSCAVAHGKVNNVDAVNKVNLWSPGVVQTPHGPVGFVENITSLKIGIKGRHNYKLQEAMENFVFPDEIKTKLMK